MDEVRNDTTESQNADKLLVADDVVTVSLSIDSMTWIILMVGRKTGRGLRCLADVDFQSLTIV